MAKTGVPVIGCTNCGDLIVAGDRISVVATGTYNEYTSFNPLVLICGGCTEATEEAMKDRQPDLYADERDYQHPGESGCCGSCDTLVRPAEEEPA